MPDDALGDEQATQQPANAPTTRGVRVAVDPACPDEGVISTGAEILLAGGLVAFPTETVYGLGAHALDALATAAIFKVKGRPSTDPLIVHVATTEAARALTRDWDERGESLATRFWPGPLTMVLPKASVVPDSITAGLDSVALRVPAHPVALALLRASKVPVAAPSANRFGRISPTTADAVESELSGGYDLLIDAGPTDVGVESTVIDLTQSTARLLRPGGVPVELIEEAIGPIEVPLRSSQSEDTDAVAPGQFLRHYSPRTPLVLVDAPPQVLTDLESRLRADGVDVRALDLPADPHDAAHVLYSVLREGDSTAELLMIRTVVASGLGAAVNDRLFRAAQGHVVSACDEKALRSIHARLDG